MPIDGWFRTQPEGQFLDCKGPGLGVLPKSMNRLQSPMHHPRQERFIGTMIHKGVFSGPRRHR